MRAVAPAILIISRAYGYRRVPVASRSICVAAEAVAVLSMTRLLHDLAGDVAGGHLTRSAVVRRTLVGHAFGNRIARCLAVDQPPLVSHA